MFLPDSGAFFVNYVITSSLIGTAMELLRIPALTVYAVRLCFAKSQAERIHVKRVSRASLALERDCYDPSDICDVISPRLCFSSAEPSLRVPVWSGVRVDHVHLCCQYDLQHHVSYYYTLW